MKIFFGASPRGKQDLSKHYKVIYQTIKELGYSHVTDVAISVEPKEHYSMPHNEIVKHYKSVINDLKAADIVVIEGSTPSLAIGYLVDKAIEFGKPVVVFHLAKSRPFFLTGIENEKVQIVEYEIEKVKKSLDDALSYAQEQMDTRFNFFISPKIGTYLDWVAKKRRLPRAVYLRRLIEQDMNKNSDFGK